MKLATQRPDGARREPLATADELAEKLGVTRYTLLRRMTARDGPKPVFRHNSSAQSRCWYRPSEIFAWWNERGAD